MQRSLAPAIALTLGICAAQPSYEISPELLTLAKIKVHMHETLARQPNYTCVEQIERSGRRGARRKFELHDMLRLEVALVDGKELFAWPGSSKFEHDDLEKIVPPGGAIGNGSFALFARGVFESNVPVFEHRGIVDLNARQAVRYDYHVPQFQSGYRLRVNQGEAIVGYHGSFWADPQTFDVVRLEVIADDIPPSLGLESASTAMDYARIRIGQADFLLPAGSELTMTHVTGEIDRNLIRFSACRQYTGESVLTFGEAPPAAAVPKPEKPIIEIPEGLSFDISLDAEIDGDRSMIGDPVTATLRQNMKQDKRVLFEKGATLTGRIVRLERHEDHCVVDLEFSEINSNTQRAAIAAGIEDAIALKGSRLHLPRGYRVRLQTRVPK